ncbi:sigma-70 family RNA polymerase sigma factor [Phormidesmis sp. 146-33]
MHPRQEITELFSTFIQFEADRFSRWLVDARLRRDCQQCLEQVSSSNSTSKAGTALSEQFWALYWYRLWQTRNQKPGVRSQELSHLSAYLQEPCYWAAQRMVRKVATAQSSLADYFQIAIAQVESVLNTYQPDRGATLRTFANLVFSTLLKDSLRQHREVDLCTNWGLLRKVSKRRLIEALTQTGLTSDAIAQYRLAWHCFNVRYVQSQSGNKALPAVDDVLWAAIATLYNAERYAQLATPGASISPAKIEQWLNHCAVSVRKYLYPAISSLNVPPAGAEMGEMQDEIRASQHESLLVEIIDQEEQQERQAQRSQLHTAMVGAITQLDSQSQQLLEMYYRQQLSQPQMAQQGLTSQATVSRRLTKARESLLVSLVQWSQQTLNKPPTANLIKEMSAALEEWLTVYYGELSSSVGTETAGQECV